MKKIKNIFKPALMAAALGCGSMFTTSCTDFLTIYPTNSTIHENYWQTAADVNGMLATTYLKLMSTDAVTRMILWGELRADNMNVRNNAANKYRYIVEANLKDDNEFCSWGSFYSAINYANMVLEFAPEVPARDPDFTEGDLAIVMGEMYALRALSHFYLVRSFRDIPLSYQTNLDDAEIGTYPQVHPTVALDSIMKDLDRAEKLVMPSGGFPTSVNPDYNYGRVTKNAVLAIKADVNLWRAAFATYYADADSVQVGNPDTYYREAITNCDEVINNMNQAMEDYYEKRGGQKPDVTKNPYYLTENTTTGASSSGSLKYKSTAYDYLFGQNKDNNTGVNRSEVIFEFVFAGIENKDANGNRGNLAVGALYGQHTDATSASGVCCVANSYVNSESLYGENDYRLYSYTTAQDLSGGSSTSASSNKNAETGIAKYSCEISPGFNMNSASYRSYSTFDANWVLYRKTDVMLMKAEALAHLSTSDAGNYKAAFDLVKAVNDRSLMLASDSLTTVTTKDEVAQLVLDERARELSFEGKRWYDLVRVALRDKSTRNILFVANKLEGGAVSAVQKKMQSMNSLFFPIAESELKLNPLLKQNPAYEENDAIQKN